jgi:polar amino acid transport system substrate-binding protein
MSVYLTLSLVAFLHFLCPPQARAADEVRVVYYNYAPHLITDQLGAKESAPKGPIPDIWEKHIAPAAKLKVKWIGPVPFPRAMAMVESGEADAIDMAAKTPDREPKFIYSSLPIVMSTTGLVVKKSEPLRAIRSIADIGSKSIGLLTNSVLLSVLEEHKEKILFEPIPGEHSAEQNLEKLLSDRIWAVYFAFPDAVLYYAALRHKLDQVKVIPFPKAPIHYAYFFMSKKADPALVKRIQEALPAATKQYDYPKMVKKTLKQIASKSHASVPKATK